jgi:cbb3-type cytochrome oxidase maturation protein
MSVIIILLIVSISVAGLFLAAFIWSVRNGQYDDDASPAIRMLFDQTTTKNKPGSNDTKAVQP